MMEGSTDDIYSSCPEERPTGAAPAGADTKPNLYSFLPSGWESGGGAHDNVNPSASEVDLSETPRSEGESEEGDDEQAVPHEDSYTPGHVHKFETVPADDEEKEHEGAQDETTLGSSKHKHKPNFAITVGEYDKHGEGQMKGYVSYKINVKTKLAQYKQPEFTVERRFSDFYWLHDKLKERFKGFIIPPMPEKTMIQNRFDVQFIENRRRELGKFLKEVVEHPTLSASEILQAFLEAPPEDFTKEKEAKPQTTVTKKMMSWVSKTVTELSPPVEIDDFFAKKATYLPNLEVQLTTLLKTSQVITAKRNELMLLFYDMSVASQQVSISEEANDQGLAHHWGKLSDASEQVRLAEQDSIVSHEVRFEEPIMHLLRQIAAAKDAMNNRSMALAEFQAAEKRLAAWNEKKAKPGFKSSAATDQTTEQYQKKVDETKEEYEMLTQSLKDELERFERVKSKEMTRAIRELAKAFLDTTLQTSDQWRKLINQVQSYEQGQ